MSYNRTNQGAPIPLKLLKSVVVGWLITIIGASIISILLHAERITEEVIKPAAVIILMLSAFVTAVIAGNATTEKRMLMCLGGGVVYYGSLVGCNALFYDAQYEGLLGALLTIMGCCLVAALLLSRQKHQRHAYVKRLPKS